MTTNDPSVKGNLQRVIAKAMKFDDNERDKVQEFHDENNRSALEKVLIYFKLIDNWRSFLN